MHVPLQGINFHDVQINSNVHSAIPLFRHSTFSPCPAYAVCIDFYRFFIQAYM